MAVVFVGIGSNFQREENLRAGIAELRDCFGTVRLSTVYESAPVGCDGDNFFNLVAAFTTDVPVTELAARLRAIEAQFGRVRDGRRELPLDLDILLYDELVTDADGLQIPRREITQNAFVLRPLAELSPEFILPGDGRTVAAIWAAYPQHLQPLTPLALPL